MAEKIQPWNIIINFCYRVQKCIQMGTIYPLWRLGVFRWRLLRAKLHVTQVVSDTTFLPQPKNCPSSFIATGNKIRDANVPLVSVIIPCYNYGAFILEAVDSVRAQTLQDVDITIVDGCSTDKTTLEILSNINQPRTRILYQREMTFVGANRNLGIAATRGRYICCLDADDRLKPTYLEKAVDLLENCCFDIVSSGYQILNRPADILLNMPTPLLEDLLLGNHMLTCAVFSRSLFEQTEGFIDTGKGPKHIAEDWRLWVNMAALGARMRNIMEPLLEYRIHEECTSLSRQPGTPPTWKQAREISIALKQLLTPEALIRSRLRAEGCLNCLR